MQTVTKHSHCGFCGAPFGQEVTAKIWPRTCASCRQVSYKNPTPVAIVIVPVKRSFFSRTGVLLVRRANRPGIPGRDMWALPGGFQESLECSSRAGTRELLEEVGIAVRHDESVLFHVEYAEAPDVQLVFWLTRPVREKDVRAAFRPNHEVSEIQFVDTPEVTLAFKSHEHALCKFFSRWYALQQVWRHMLHALRF